MGLGNEGVAFAFLGADREQPNARTFDAQFHPAVVGAQDRIVDEMLGFGLGICTSIDEDKVAVFARYDRGKSGTVHTIERT